MNLAGCFLFRASLEVAVKHWLKLTPLEAFLTCMSAPGLGTHEQLTAHCPLPLSPSLSLSVPLSLSPSLSPCPSLPNTFSHLHIISSDGCPRVAGCTWWLKAPRASPKRNWWKWHGLLQFSLMSYCITSAIFFSLSKCLPRYMRSDVDSTSCWKEHQGICRHLLKPP